MNNQFSCFKQFLLWVYVLANVTLSIVCRSAYSGTFIWPPLLHAGQKNHWHLAGSFPILFMGSACWAVPRQCLLQPINVKGNFRIPKDCWVHSDYSVSQINREVIVHLKCLVLSMKDRTVPNCWILLYQLGRPIYLRTTHIGQKNCHPAFFTTGFHSKCVM